MRALSLFGGRRLPSQLLVGLEGSGGGRLVSGGSAGWLSDPLRPSTSSIRASSLPAGVLPTVHQGSRLTQELQTLLRQGAVAPAPQSPGFYSRLFLVQKASGSWRPIIDLSTLYGLSPRLISTWRLHSQSFVPSAQVAGCSLWTGRTPSCRFLFITIRVVIFASW